MITDKQCAEFMRLQMPINDILREAFKAGFRAGDAAQDGAVGDALRSLERAVRADKIGRVHVASKYDDNGMWRQDSFATTSAALGRLDALRDAAEPGIAKVMK